jgi:hypothetical protein
LTGSMTAAPTMWESWSASRARHRESSALGSAERRQQDRPAKLFRAKHLPPHGGKDTYLIIIESHIKILLYLNLALIYLSIYDMLLR